MESNLACDLQFQRRHPLLKEALHATNPEVPPWKRHWYEYKQQRLQR